MITPTSVPARMPHRKPTGSGAPALTTIAEMTPDRPTTEPMEISIPAVISTYVMPTARMPLIDVWLSTRIRFDGVRNDEHRMLTTISSARNAMTIAYFSNTSLAVR